MLLLLSKMADSSRKQISIRLVKIKMSQHSKKIGMVKPRAVSDTHDTMTVLFIELFFATNAVQRINSPLKNSFHEKVYITIHCSMCKKEIRIERP